MTYARPMFPPRAEALPKPFQIDRRGLLCELAAVPAASFHLEPAGSPGVRRASPDPILAAIGAFRLAKANLDRATEASEAALENGVITNMERWDAQDRCYDEVFEPGLRRLISTTPMTPAGLAALLGFVREQGGVLELIGDDSEKMAIFERSLESAACAWAGLLGGVNA